MRRTNIEDQIVDFVGLDLYDGALRECQIKPDEYKLDDIGEIISLLDSMCGIMLQNPHEYFLLKK